MIEVRRATLDDLAAVRVLLGETWHATYDAIYGNERVAQITATWHSVDALRRHLDSGGLRLVAVRDGVIVGTAADLPSGGGDHVKLAQLYVLPAGQGTGKGQALLDAFIAAFQSARRITLEVEPANTRAIAFYARHRFAKIGEVANCGGGASGIQAVVMGRAN